MTAGERRAAWLGLVAASLGWAGAFVVGKVVVATLPPLVASCARYALATAALLPFALRARPGRARLRELAVPLAVMSVAGGVLYQWIFLEAVARTTATASALLIAVNPVLTVVAAPLVGEPLTRARLGGALLAFVGAAVVISHGDVHALLALRLGTGDTLALLAACCWATFNLAARRVAGRVAPSVANVAVYATGAVVQGLLAWHLDPGRRLADAPAGTLLGVAFLGIGSSALCGQLFLHGVRVLGVGTAASFVYLVPVETALLAAVTLGERPGAAQLVGGAAVLAGVALAARAPRPQTP